MTPDDRTRDEELRNVLREFENLEAMTGAIAEATQDLVDLSGPHLIALRAIHLGAQKVGDVASFTRTHVSSASRSVDQLLDAGLVTRDENPDDRRSVLLGLTDAGRAVFDRLEAFQHDMISTACADLSVDELRAFSSTLSRLRAGAVAAVEGSDRRVLA